MNSDVEYDPNNLNYCYSLINSDYTNMSLLETKMMNKKKATESFEARLFRIIPMVRLQLSFAEVILQESLKTWKKEVEVINYVPLILDPINDLTDIDTWSELNNFKKKIQIRNMLA